MERSRRTARCAMRVWLPAIVLCLLPAAVCSGEEAKTYDLVLKPYLTERFYLSQYTSSQRDLGSQRIQTRVISRSIVRTWTTNERTDDEDAIRLRCHWVSHDVRPEKLDEQQHVRSYVVSERHRPADSDDSRRHMVLFNVPLPKKAIPIGDTWSTERVTQAPPSVAGARRWRRRKWTRTCTYRLSGHETYRGKKYLRIDYEGKWRPKDKEQSGERAEIGGYVLFCPRRGLFVMKCEELRARWKLRAADPPRMKLTETTREVAVLIPESHEPPDKTGQRGGRTRRGADAAGNR